MKTYVLTSLLFLSTFFVIAQEQDPVIMMVNGKDIKKSEFDYIYNKNNNEDVIDQKTLGEYIELFKNFKLKVEEAESQGLDTTATFKEELAEYRSQLAKPYLADLIADEVLLRKEYKRMNELVQVAHILILFPRNMENNISQMLPTDTLETYTKIEQVYSLLNKGRDFGKLVAEYSDDLRTKENPVPGYLGWVSGMMLHPDLEEEVFATEMGKFSKPVRTNYGYHIIKVLDKKINPGQINAAHILIQFPENANEAQKTEVKNQIDEIYQKIQTGADFAELAREYSQDGSASRGGDLDWFGYGNMVKEFEEEAFALKDTGDISKPFASVFGYHIVKLLDKKPTGSFEEIKSEIESKYANGGFFNLIYQPTIKKLMTNNDFVRNKDSYELLLNSAQETFPANDLYLEKFASSDEVLFMINSRKISIADFILYLQSNIGSYYSLSTDFLNDKLACFEYDQLVKAEDATLENKYPEFRNLMQEYRDGILMFEISNKEVWNKASEDTEDLKRFFEMTKNEYRWDQPHYRGYVVLVKDEDTKKKIQKEIKKMKPEEAAEYMLENYRVGAVSYVKIEKGLFKKGDNEFVDEAIFKTGKANCPEDFKAFFVVGKVLKAPESYMDARGSVITNYQDYLETEWLKKLNEKYPVVIYEDALFIKK